MRNKVLRSVGRLAGKLWDAWDSMIWAIDIPDWACWVALAVGAVAFIGGIVGGTIIAR